MSIVRVCNNLSGREGICYKGEQLSEGSDINYQLQTNQGCANPAGVQLFQWKVSRSVIESFATNDNTQ
jgi:hypothetical protein